MSTKIYNAYEWTGDYTSLIKYLNELNTKYMSDSVNRVLKLYQFDSAGKYENANRLYDLITKDSSQDEKGHPYDMSLSCVVYMHKGKIILHFFGVNSYTHPIVYETLNQLPDYSYWNNTDGPDDVAEEAFESRGKWYDDLFDTYGSTIPSKCGLVYNYASDTNMWNIATCSYEQWKVKNEVR